MSILNPEKKLKIAFLTPNFPPETGGMGSSCFYLASELAQTEDVTVFLPERDGQAWQAGDYQIETFRPLFSYGYSDLFRFSKQMLAPFDIVHVYYPYIGVAEFLSYRMRGTRFIIHHNMDIVGEGIVKFFAGIQKKYFQKKIYRRSDAIFALSDDYARHSSIAKIYRKKPQKCFILPHGVDVDKFQKQPNEETNKLKEELKITPDDFVVFTAQGLDKQHFFKGIDVLIKATFFLVQKENINIKTVIAGDGDLRAEYEDLARELGIEDRVIFLGRVPNADLAQYYSLADVTAVPSTASTECFSIVAVESMACGTPVIVSNWPGIRATITAGETGFIVKSKSVIGLASEIKKLYQDRDLLARMKKACRPRVLEHYDWRYIAEQAKQYYHQLLDK